MAFFEDLGKKITQTSQGVVQKTKDTAEVIKLNGMISDEEKHMNSLYTQIGKQYFELHSGAPEAALQDYVSEIKAAKIRIEDYSEQAKKLKGVVCCPNCGGDVQYGAPFCSSCGMKMEINAEQAVAGNSNVKRCVACGMPLNEGSVFCTHCGARVEETFVVQEEPLQQEQPKLCSNCQNEVDEDSAFCMNCGTKIDN